jgi:hypothetical protein
MVMAILSFIGQVMLKQSHVFFIAIAFITTIPISGCDSHLKTHGTQTTNVLKGPYLVYPGSNTQMMVLWQVDSDTPCSLSWGTDTTYSAGNTATSEYNANHQHKYTIDGVTPGKKYYYQVAAGQKTYAGSFLAAPPADATAVEFFGYGDTRTNPDQQEKVCRNIISTYTANPNCQTFILHVGDWVSGDSEKAWTSEFFNRTSTANTTMQANLPIQGCIGNHEGNGTFYKKYWPYSYVADRYWSFDYGPVHIAVIDQYADYGPQSAQLQWLASDMSSSTKPWKFVVLHEPGWSAGSFHGNNTAVQQNIQPLCKQYGVQIVFAGHNHYYARAVVDGVQHVTIGGGGAPLYTPKAGMPNVVTSKSALGYCKVNIVGNTLRYQMLESPDNTVIDSFTIKLP